jgi:integrase
MTMREVVNRFLFDRKGVIEPDTYRQHRRALRRFVKWCGAGRAAVDLGPTTSASTGKLRAKLGGYAYNRERAAILAALNHADAQGWIERVPKLGAGFKRTPKSKLRAGKRDRLLKPDDVNALLGVAGPNLFGMILLGLNGGFGAKDCAALHWRDVDLDGAVLTFPAPRTTSPAPCRSGRRRSTPCASCAASARTTPSCSAPSADSRGRGRPSPTRFAVSAGRANCR